MDTSFDNSALTYDQAFTNSNIGKYLRKRVHEYLDSALYKNKKLRILELNCGTGEDAIFLARKGFTVLASDASGKMIEAAKQKVHHLNENLEIDFKQIDINDINRFPFIDKFDLVFSNFGGLNCISPNRLKELSRDLKKMMEWNGRFILVVMSKYCLWEILYYLVKGKLNKSFRRVSNSSLDVNVNGKMIETFYYTPSELQKLFLGNFMLTKKIPIGLFIPPTYMENYFKKRIKFLSHLDKLDSAFSRNRYFSVLGDHFLLDFIVK